MSSLDSDGKPAGRPTRKQLKARIRDLESELAWREPAGPVTVELTQPGMPGGSQVVLVPPGMSKSVTVHGICWLASGASREPTYILIPLHLKAWRTP